MLLLFMDDDKGELGIDASKPRLGPGVLRVSLVFRLIKMGSLGSI